MLPELDVCTLCLKAPVCDLQSDAEVLFLIQPCQYRLKEFGLDEPASQMRPDINFGALFCIFLVLESLSQVPMLTCRSE